MKTTITTGQLVSVNADTPCFRPAFCTSLDIEYLAHDTLGMVVGSERSSVNYVLVLLVTGDIRAINANKLTYIDEVTDGRR